jgi:hypothetical protein
MGVIDRCRGRVFVGVLYSQRIEFSAIYAHALTHTRTRTQIHTHGHTQAAHMLAAVSLYRATWVTN